MRLKRVLLLLFKIIIAQFIFTFTLQYYLSYITDYTSENKIISNIVDLKYSMDGMINGWYESVNEKPWVHWNKSGWFKTWSNLYFVRIAKFSRLLVFYTKLLVIKQIGMFYRCIL